MCHRITTKDTGDKVARKRGLEGMDLFPARVPRGAGTPFLSPSVGAVLTPLSNTSLSSGQQRPRERGNRNPAGRVGRELPGMALCGTAWLWHGTGDTPDPGCQGVVSQTIMNYSVFYVICEFPPSFFSCFFPHFLSLSSIFALLPSYLAPSKCGQTMGTGHCGAKREKMLQLSRCCSKTRETEVQALSLK